MKKEISNQISKGNSLPASRHCIEEAMAMINFIAKCFIVFLAVQSAMDYLRNQGIIEGSIKINYPVMKPKLLALIPMVKISNLVMQCAGDKINDVITDKYLMKCNQIEYDPERFNCETPSYRLLYHVVDYGETLNELSHKYHVHWKVIKKINQIDGDIIREGQVLKLPSRKIDLI